MSTNESQSRQRHRRAPKVGRDRIQGQTRLGRPIHEHPALEHGRIRRRRQLRHTRSGLNTVQQRSLDRQGGRGATEGDERHGYERLRSAASNIGRATTGTRRYNKSRRRRVRIDCAHGTVYLWARMGGHAVRRQPYVRRETLTDTTETSGRKTRNRIVRIP